MSEMHFEKGQILVYGTNGICVVDDIRPMKIAMDAKPEPYYILKLKRDARSSVSIPVRSIMLTSKMRDVMTAGEIQDMFAEAKEHKMGWEADRRTRTEKFRDILLEGVSSDLLRMVICIYERKKRLASDGKKLPVTDGNTFKSAVKLLEEEVGYAMDMDQDKVASYIMKKVGIKSDIDEA